MSPVQGHEKVVALSTVVFPIHLHERTKFGHGCFELDLFASTFRPVSGFTFFRIGMFSPGRPQGAGRTRRTHAIVAVFMLWPLRLLCLRYIPDNVFPSIRGYI